MHFDHTTLTNWNKKRKQYLYVTLVELLVVIGLLAILAALMIPSMLDARCRAKIEALLSLLNSIRTDISTVTANGQATAGAVNSIIRRIDNAVNIFREAKSAKCITQKDKTTINTTIDKALQELLQIKSSQTKEVQQLIDKLIEKLTGEKYPD